MDITQTIEAKNYEATEQDVERLAAAHLSAAGGAQRSAGAYLRILIAACIAEFGGRGRGRRAKLTAADITAHRAYLATVHTRLYPAVVRGITTPEIADDPTAAAEVRRARAEMRTNRAGFARSAASTLQAFIRVGGDVRSLRVDEVTKTWLRAYVIAAEAPGVAPRAQAVRASAKRYVNELAKLCADDPDEGREEIERALAELNVMLERLNVPVGPGTPADGQRRVRLRPVPVAAHAH